MTRDEIINGLEREVKSIRMEPQSKMLGVCITVDEAEDIVSLLKEHEPKAIEYHDNPFTGLPVALCPNCMRYARQFLSSIEEETHYCPWCGQAVKWE